MPDPEPPGRAAQRPKLADVAALAGVSLRTASRALAGEPNVSQAKRDGVFAAARMLQFQPNRLARELRSGAQTTAVGLVVANLANPFFSAMAATAEAELRPRGLELFIGSTDEDPERERAVVQAALQRRAHAMLVVPSAEDQSYLQHEVRLGTPLIFLDRPPGNLAADAIIGNDRAAARRAMLDLLALHERCGVIGDIGVAWTDRERVEGVREAIAAAGAPAVRHPVLSQARDVETAYRLTLDLLREPEPPTALFGLNNLITAGILKALRDTAAEVSVLGFDDSDVMDILGVSALAVSPVELGRSGARRALARIDDPSLQPTRTVLEAVQVRRTPLDRPIRLAPREPRPEAQP